VRPIVGVDLSLTATGVALAGGPRLIRSKRKGLARLHEISGEILDIARAEPDTLVIIEGYSFSSHAAHAHELGALGGVVRYRLWRRGIAFVDVAPATLKKYATGKGNAPKELVLAEAIRRLGYTGSSHDEADAIWLRAIGCALLDTPIVTLPAAHRVALDVLRDVLPPAARSVS